MSEHEMRRFHATVWPAVGPLPLPALWRWSEPGGESIPAPALSHELVIRKLQALDPADPDACLAFTIEHGLIVGPDRGAEWRLFPIPEPASAPRWTPGISDEDATTRLHYQRLVDGAHLRTAQALGKHWLARERGEPVSSAWAPMYGSIDEQSAWRYFARNLNSGLRTFQTRVMIFDSVESVELDPLQADLYDALCLQLWNLLLEGVAPRQCPHCGSAFVHQQNPATIGQYRSVGVTYCSRSCASSAGRKRRREAARGA